MEHIELVYNLCDKVLDVRHPYAIWYVDGGFRTAEVFEPDEGWVSYSCNTQDEWDMLCDMARHHGA